MSVITMMTVNGFIGVHCTTDSVNEFVFCDAIEQKLLPHLMPFSGSNPHSIVPMDNCAIIIQAELLT